MVTRLDGDFLEVLKGEKGNVEVDLGKKGWWKRRRGLIVNGNEESCCHGIWRCGLTFAYVSVSSYASLCV
ncbi:hypothetical protein VNO77_19925 [Canavalia gladiata]|uniref:Uncharacterized protein n=1 Tax=Canavalia gladiata TaxID=3824 RepID=A0AAN9LS78_CANGL